MQIDDLKESWAAHGTKLERSLAINERLLREMILRKVRHGLAPYLLWRALEVALGAATLLVMVPVLAAHGGEPRYVVAAALLLVFIVGITAMSAYLLVGGLQLNYGGSVAAIQCDIGRIRLVEYRALKWAVLGGIVVWLPAALVLFEALTGVEALARAGLPWLVANLFVGLVVLAFGQSLSRKYVERSDLGPRARRLVDAVSGRALRSAGDHLEELSKFRREEPSDGG